MKQLSEHVHEALVASAARVLERHPDPDLREALAVWNALLVEGRHPTLTLTVRLEADRRRGRVDTRSTLAVVTVVDAATGEDEELCRVRVRDLLDADGRPVDARVTARELLWQHGHGIPDDPSALTDDGNDNDSDHS